MKCCSQEMICLNNIDVMDTNTNKIDRCVCKECGRIIDIVDFFLDYEEMKALKGNCAELKNLDLEKVFGE